MKISSNTFCSMAWNHQFVDPTGRIKPCCRFGDKHRPSNHNTNEKTLSEVFYGDWMNDIRTQMLNGERVPGCDRCYQEEDSGKKSLRQRYNDSSALPIEKLVDMNNPKIKWIELAISNDCNLACRMCDSRYSWKWFDEEKEIYGKTWNNVEHSKMDISNVFPFIQDIVHMKFTGGEPLMTKDHWVLLDKIVAERDCSEIFINYSTNCTIMPKTDWIEKWGKFKSVEFALSFDSCNKQEWEYIRWPSKYETAEAVTKKFLSLGKEYNFISNLRSSISIFNIWHTPETIEWWLENSKESLPNINPTHVTHPNFMSIRVLPLHVKRRVTEKFKSFSEKSNNEIVSNRLMYLVNYMNSSDDSYLLPELKKYISGTDNYRNQNFFDYYPQFIDLFD